MAFTKTLPTWNAVGVEPPQSLKDAGWKAGVKPPSDYFNWLQNKAYEVLKELQENAIHKEEKGIANGVATLGSNGKVPSSQLPSLDYVPTSQKGVANGVATLGADGKVPASQLSVSSNASGVAITDAGNYYASANVEDTLQEIGLAFNGVRGIHVTDIDGILGS